jgi:hypothetical protein
MALKSTLERIRTGDRKTKLRWLIGCSAIAMIFVVGIWIAYVQSVVNEIGGAPRTNPQNSTITALAVGTSKVIDVVKRKTAGTILYFQNLITTNTTFTIKPDESATSTNQ